MDHGRQVAFDETQNSCDQYEMFLRGEYEIAAAETSVDQREPERMAERGMDQLSTQKPPKKIDNIRLSH